jgi:hypothetical protein
VAAAGFVRAEVRLQRVLMAYIVTGLVFMLLPGTLAGVWNLVSISDRHGLESLSPAWLQAHGHAQIFGWIATFILGIGFHSVKKAPVERAWTAYALWTAGVTMRWSAGVTGWNWRVLLPLGGALELAAFLIFFWTVSGHRSEGGGERRFEPWMALVAASTFGFLMALTMNFVATLRVAVVDATPALPHALAQRLSGFAAWAFLVPAIWGFSARWLPSLFGVGAARMRGLFVALACVLVAQILSAAAWSVAAAILLACAAFAAIWSLRVAGAGFPGFIRVAYSWLGVSSILWVCAALFDRSGGIWGAARHALTVGFISTMVFAIGQRVLPAFAGARVLHSERLRFLSLAALTVGCALRVSAEIPAYEGYARFAWRVLPWSAVIELAGVTLFAVNLILTFLDLPAHVRQREALQ